MMTHNEQQTEFCAERDTAHSPFFSLFCAV